MFDANYNADQSNGLNPQIGTPTIVGQSVTLTVTSFPVKTSLLAIAGETTLPVTVSSTVVWGQSKLWVALVLDNTGSMTQTDSTGTSKLTALKNASNQLLTTLQNAQSNEGDIKVSITPFAKVVNVGTGNVSASWIDWTDWGAEPVDSSGTSG